ncbi:MAG: trehalase family glycosidase [Synechococcales bacterium]|nr:trehalase family glycosidase [Synechococcales bacterium]
MKYFFPDESPTLPSRDRLKALRAYIKATWTTLTRTQSHILDAAKDSKLNHEAGTPWPVHVSPHEDIDQVKASLQQALSPEELSQIRVAMLPAEVDQIEEHGLLYLPKDYVVPGGRFNELYGWDSYFIVLGLLHDGEITLARNMVDLHIYEIEHYGTVLNGNRTYMLDRSHPPLLTPTVLRVFQQVQDEAWLRSLLPAIENYYFYWTVPPHLNPATGLSRYYALGHGPAPEVVCDEVDEYGRSHYDRVCDYYRIFADDQPFNDYDLKLYYDEERDCLTELFYQGDRSMRESGFDITNRFGPFSADIIHYAPVCLNVLLYQMERDLAQIHQILGHLDSASHWQQQSDRRRAHIDQFLWDDRTGLYLDYNFRTGQRRPYPFATTFMPLWAGVASEHQAKRLVDNLPMFESCGGLLTSTQVSGNQWDAPFGWAPLHLFAIAGLRRYGYEKEARRIACKFIHLVTQEFERSGTIMEKYDVVKCSANVSNEIQFGYSSNEIGFGWTNGVLLELLSYYAQSSS